MADAFPMIEAGLRLQRPFDYGDHRMQQVRDGLRHDAMSDTEHVEHYGQYISPNHGDLPPVGSYYPL